jgi:hypothetical protein
MRKSCAMSVATVTAIPLDPRSAALYVGFGAEPHETAINGGATKPARYDDHVRTSHYAYSHGSEPVGGKRALNNVGIG